jgi:E3 ubiquitin-protein ligase SIAH1
MERVVNSIFVPCKHGCATKITSYQKEEHEEGCPSGPCFCPVSGCGFAGKSAPLLDHLTNLHKLPTKTFKYFVPFDLRVQPVSLVLRGGYKRLFLLEVAPLESLGHSVSLFCAARNASIGTITCSVGFSCFEGHYQLSSLEVGKSVLSDELPTKYFCVVPKVSGEQTDVMLRIMIDLLYDHREQEELEDEDDNDDSSYNPNEDDNMTAKQRMVITEVVVKKYLDGNFYEVEDDDSSSEESSDDEDLITTSRTKWIMTMKNDEKEDDKHDGTDNHNGD